MNTHEVMLNMQTNKIIFKTDRCIHSEVFNSLRASDKRRFFSRDIYLLSLTSFEKSSVSINSQKYKILQRRSSSMIAKIRSSRSTVENYEDEEKLSLKIVLDHNSRYVIEEIDKEYSSIRLFRKKRRVKIIRDFQQFTLIEISIRRFDLTKKSIRRSFRSSKSHVIESDDMRFDIEKSMNIVFIEVVAFQFLADIKNKKKEIKTFFFSMKQLNEIIDKVREALSKNTLEFKEALAIMKATIEKLKRKIFEFLKRFESVLNFKKTDKLSSHRFYDHQIELIENSAQLFRSRVYFLSFKKLETLQKYFHENFQKEFINSSKTSYVSSILFVVKFNEQLRLCVDYRKLNAITCYERAPEALPQGWEEHVIRALAPAGPTQGISASTCTSFLPSFRILV